MAKEEPIDLKSVLKELDTIKRLLVFDLMRKGATQAEIAAILKVTQSTVRQAYPKPSTRNPSGK